MNNGLYDLGNMFAKEARLGGNPEEDAMLRIKNQRLEKEREYAKLTKLYQQIVNQTKILTNELCMYQERMGIIHFDEDLKAKEDDPILRMIGIKKLDNQKLFSGTFDYISPILLSYKHKIQTLDDHLKKNYRKIVRYENDIKNQREMQEKILSEIEEKFNELINVEQNLTEEPNVEFDFMDRVSKDDLLDKIDNLEKQNEISNEEILRLKREQGDLKKAVENSKQSLSLLRDKNNRLEDEEINHNLEKLERENSLLSQKYIETTEKNSEIDGALMKLKTELADLEREKRTLSQRMELEKEQNEKSEEEAKKYEKKVEKELRKLETKEENLKLKIGNLDSELKIKRNEIDRMRTTVDKLNQEKDELSKVWQRLRVDSDSLQKKKNEFKEILNQHKLKNDEATKISSLGPSRKQEYEKRIEELKSQHKKRMDFMKQEHDRKKKREVERLQAELKSREVLLDNIKERVRSLEDDDNVLVAKIEGLQKEKERYFQLEKDEVLRKKELERLQKELEAAQDLLIQKEKSVLMLRNNQGKDYDIILEENRRLHVSVNELQFNKNKLQEELDTLDTRYNTLHKELETNKFKFDHSIRNNHQRNLEIEKSLKSQIDQMDEKNQNLKQNIKEIFNKNEQEENQLKERIRKKKVFYEEKLSNYQKEINDLKLKLRNLAGKV